jgi:membrane-associated protease RseP (regulator of RpoE activity)
MDIREVTRQHIEALKGVVDIDVAYSGSEDIIFRGVFSNPLGATETQLLNRISFLPGKPEIVSLQPKVVIRIHMPGKIGAKKIPWLNIILFMLTLISTIIVGASYDGVDFVSKPEMFWKNPLKIITAGIPFSFSLLAILLFHEFGHYIASRRHDVKVSLPYFLPFPNIIGTLGAVIRSKSPFINRKQLFDVGATGPLSGMVIAIPIVIWGLAHPRFIPETTDITGLIMLGDSILFSFINILVQPPIPEGYVAVLHPVAFSGWVGFLVTMLNLMPIGQLDGGHILYAMFGKTQHKIAHTSFFVLLALSFLWLGWIFWGLFCLILIRPHHPPTVMDDIPLDRKRMLIGYICIIVFILCFMPTPFIE